MPRTILILRGRAKDVFAILRRLAQQTPTA